MVYIINFHSNATRTGWHLWEIDLRFSPGLPPGWPWELLPECQALLKHGEAECVPRSIRPCSVSEGSGYAAQYLIFTAHAQYENPAAQHLRT